MRPGRAEKLVILYEDDDIVAVVKPEGLAVIAPQGSRTRSLYDIVTIHLRQRNPKGRAAVVHRLDRDTSGIMIFAKHAAAKKRLMENWNALVRERCYTALVVGTMDESGIFDSWLSEDTVGRVRETSPGAHGSLRAVTRWKKIREGGGFSLLELSLETGRKHQIRVQLAGSGHPVAGDPKYGQGVDPLGRLALHAHLLVLEHPFTGEIMRLENAAPLGFVTGMGNTTARATASPPKKGTSNSGQSMPHPETADMRDMRTGYDILTGHGIPAKLGDRISLPVSSKKSSVRTVGKAGKVGKSEDARKTGDGGSCGIPVNPDKTGTRKKQILLPEPDSEAKSKPASNATPAHPFARYMKTQSGSLRNHSDLRAGKSSGSGRGKKK